MKNLLAEALLVVSLVHAQAQRILSLSDVAWSLSNGVNATARASFPSQAHLDLYAAGIIPNPLYGFNDVRELWVERSNWTYTSEPIAGLREADIASAWLIFEGLDTFVDIALCNQSVGSTANQFRQFYFDVSSILNSCEVKPVLELSFGSATKIVLDIAKTGPAYINSANGITGQEFQGKVYMRKEQNDFGWDWSPALSPAGPWKPGYLIQLSMREPVYVRNTLIDIYRQGQVNNLPPDQSEPFVFNASVDFIGDLPQNAKFHLKLTDSTGHVVKQAELTNITRNNETISGSIAVNEAVDLWWPSGMGAQALYNASLSLSSPDGQILVTTAKRVGFRTVVLNLSPITSEQVATGIAPGSNWHFEINGHTFYAKGSNFVPPDAFWPRVNNTRIQELFELVVTANQNMLRVWSSGAYLPDWIYDKADEMGILLWSEFEFSDAEYPDTPGFLANYEAEAYHNVRRVNHHPSLALWAGGNELESIILAYFFDAGSPVLQGYEKVFEELLVKCVYANSRSISYIPSSTYNGFLSLDFNSVRPQTPRYNNRSSPDALYSDTDNYNYDATQAFNLSSYPIGRFADEFGFISMPSLQSWQEALPADQLNLESAGVLHHNRHYPFGASGNDTVLSAQGIQEMTDAVKLWYPTPNISDPTANFSAWAWSTQVFQADYYASEIANYRRGSAFKERQLGCLYWQLEDLWVAPTWSSIEANGRPKVLYYSAKDVYEHLIVWPYFDNETDSLEVWVTSDLWSAASGTAYFSWVDWNGDALPIAAPDGMRSEHPNNTTGPLTASFTVGAINATRVLSYTKVSSLFSAKHPMNDAVLKLAINASTEGSAHGIDAHSPTTNYSHTSYFHPISLSTSALRDPSLKLTHEPIRPGTSTISFTVSATNAIAAWVWLDHPSSVRGYFDDNAFWLMKGESRTVRFNVWNEWTDAHAWVDKVTVRSIWNNTLVA